LGVAGPDAGAESAAMLANETAQRMAAASDFFILWCLSQRWVQVKKRSFLGFERCDAFLQIAQLLTP